jgi:hypothetical protein
LFGGNVIRYDGLVNVEVTSKQIMITSQVKVHNDVSGEFQKLSNLELTPGVYP